ncbi:MAG: glycosyltransferase family 1 protein, partial [Reyranella sp.]|nr:glycosyltransferase family 1 protein [Reyranella sp.]
MRVLLHTPLKPPDSPVPSGDREMARGLARLLRRLGYTVVMPPLSRVPPGVPRPAEHLACERRARRQAARLIARWRALPPRHPERFDLWLTYHCYYRKPDWLGPIVTRALG